MKMYIFIVVSFLILFSGCTQTSQPVSTSSGAWQEEFGIKDCTLVTTGNNPYFILDPGFTLVLEGGTEKVVIKVLDETMVVDGVETRLIEEREWRDGELIEVSLNMFAMCEETQDVFYFGEYVDMYSGGELTSHQGAWIAGEDDARAGMIMPGEPIPGMRYYQEIAPGVAMDRAEIISLDKELTTPAGTFTDCLETVEGTALNLVEREVKIYAPGIGLIQDANIFLTEYGYIEDI
ncbi:MAG: hypothetical protein PVI99_01215 [Anaerolineales bacterium]|jgi:hypothetical protein